MGVRGTRVEEISAADRPNYDMFRYDGTYYAYNNDRWYSSRMGTGDFTVIDNSAVPSELSRVPRDHWRNYPSTFQDADYQARNNVSTTFQVSYNSRPQWSGVRGARGVMEIRNGARPDYDMFRFNGNYYAYSNNRWYMSHRSRGQFTMIDERAVPREFGRVPRDHWRNYPSDMVDRSNSPTYPRRGYHN
jgi:hypothetical protein